MTRCSSGPTSPKTTTTVSGTLASDRRQARDSEAVGRHLALRVAAGGRCWASAPGPLTAAAQSEHEAVCGSFPCRVRRNPDSGATDARVLHALAWLGGNNDITFGVWSDIIPRPYSCR